MEIKRLNIWSVTKITGVIYAGFGLVIGLFFALLSFLGAGMTQIMAPNDVGGDIGFMGLFFGVGAVVALPIFYGILGALGGMLCSAIYNVAARSIGGIVIEVE